MCVVYSGEFYQVNFTDIRESFYAYDPYQQELERFYGDGFPKNPKAQVFDAMLTKWDQIASNVNIRYSATYGTYLGWLRTGGYIPYDGDMDVHIGSESVAKLMAMNGMDGCCETSQLGQCSFETDVPKLVLNSYHERRVEDQYRPRYECDGKPTKTQSDDCAFTGPIARVIYPSPGKRYDHLDIFLYLREDDEKKRSELTSKGLASEFEGPFASYVSSSSGSQLPPVKPCTLHGIKTSCFEDGHDLMKNVYGENYFKPNHVWDNASHTWVKTS